jgi:hypothetical protein
MIIGNPKLLGVFLLTVAALVAVVGPWCAVWWRAVVGCYFADGYIDSIGLVLFIQA